jgi:hypothetical protein
MVLFIIYAAFWVPVTAYTAYFFSRIELNGSTGFVKLPSFLQEHFNGDPGNCKANKDGGYDDKLQHSLIALLQIKRKINHIV